MEIKVLGSGCASCKKLLALTEKAVVELGSDARVIYVTDMEEIIKTGIMSTPGLMIDGKIKSMGRIPNHTEIMKMIADGG
ncbi:MAG: TM0996/MTH895 family glutaredoxin-like protein [Clostridia bacterium]|nr:TM0996/MTH895 family glutaredoxin-like protein [Clostridia bacterium]